MIKKLYILVFLISAYSFGQEIDSTHNSLSDIRIYINQINERSYSTQVLNTNDGDYTIYYSGDTIYKIVNDKSLVGAITGYYDFMIFGTANTVQYYFLNCELLYCIHQRETPPDASGVYKIFGSILSFENNEIKKVIASHLVYNKVKELPNSYKERVFKKLVRKAKKLITNKT